jgi:hypothetical protein
LLIKLWRMISIAAGDSENEFSYIPVHNYRIYGLTDNV